MDSPYLMMLLAKARQDELRRAADARNRQQLPSETQSRVSPESSVTLRTGSPADEDPLRSLAALTGAKAPAQPVVLAEVDGLLRAALSLFDGALVVHPRHLTAGLIELLRARARQLEGPGPAPRWRGFRRLKEGS